MLGHVTGLASMRKIPPVKAFVGWEKKKKKHSVNTKNSAALEAT